MEDREYLISLARKFVSEHKAVDKIGDNRTNEKGLLCFDVDIKVNLPSSFKKSAQTKKCVKNIERVVFEFPHEFPFKSPQLYLRDDFNKNFAHINPTTEKVNPCIFEGSLDELIQQPLWMDGVIDQLVDWLETSAADSMINPSQGWEPMRVDDNNGFFIFDQGNLIKKHIIDNFFSFPMMYKKMKNITVGRVLNDNEKFTEGFNNGVLFCFTSQVVSKEYLPAANITNFVSLVSFAEKNKINNFKGSVNKNFEKLRKGGIEFLFISFFIKRPYFVIGTNSDIEILHFTLEIKEHKKKKSEFHQDSKVTILAGLNLPNSEILQQFSGVKQVTKKNQKIIQIGCGSLGSKIAMHLGRNGNDNFILVDNKYFAPNNNARHALFSSSSIFTKVEILQKAMYELGLKNIQIENKSIFDIVNIGTSNEDIIVDSTASMSVNNFLTKQNFSGRLIHTSLYHNGTIAFIGIEEKDRKVKIIDIVAYMYHLCTEKKEIAKKITNTHASYQSIGQGCGSFTTVCSDATISISSAGMSNIIQSKIDNGFSDKGELYLGLMDDDKFGMQWTSKVLEPLEVRMVYGIYGEKWEVRIFQHALESIKTESLRWNNVETGGILIGHISISTQTIVVTGQLEAPEDSVRGKAHFSSGVKDLSQKIKDIENSSATMITQLGTWHSHTTSSLSPSSTDLDGKKAMYKDRKEMPTICIIWAKDDFLVY